MSNDNSNPSGSALSAEEIDILVLIERTGAGLSMVGIVAVIASYLLLERLRTTPNLFLFLAILSNAGASIASMIGYDGLERGEDSALCQAQSFIFQWFMQADPWWSFAMSINVYLVFFHNANPDSFRRYVWVYCVVCFGGPLVTAIALISIEGRANGLVFGDAVMWCWIGNSWSLVRLYSYYIPVWICIFLSIVIYFAVGYHVFHHRNMLRDVAFNRSEDEEEEKPEPICDRGSASGDSSLQHLTGQNEHYGTVITEVQVTDSRNRRDGDELPILPPPVHVPSIRRYGSPWSSRLMTSQHESESAGGQRIETVCVSERQAAPKSSWFGRLRAAKSRAALKLKRLDPVKMGYLRTSFIFGAAVLITWIPSSVNRLYSLISGGQISFRLSVASGSVLPLQGVWNAIIFFSTSWGIVKEEVRRCLLPVFRKSPDKRQTFASRDCWAYDSSHPNPSCEPHNKLERCQIPSSKLRESTHSDVFDIELEDRRPG